MKLPYNIGKLTIEDTNFWAIRGFLQNPEYIFSKS